MQLEHWLTQMASPEIHNAHTLYEMQSLEYLILVSSTDDNQILNKSMKNSKPHITGERSYQSEVADICF